jgi:hypothetical protein
MENDRVPDAVNVEKNESAKPLSGERRPLACSIRQLAECTGV